MGKVALKVEELEELLAPSPITTPGGPLLGLNLNETLVSVEAGLKVEELEEMIAPKGIIPIACP